jgi:SulP family sulfate permease
MQSPGVWRWDSITIGTAAAVVMVAAPRFTKAVPAAILGLGAGVAAYFLLALNDPALLQLADNPLVVGPLGGGNQGLLQSITVHWNGLSGMDAGTVATLAVPAVTLAVLLSIDTLKTCVVLDAMTRSRHNSNRELIAQGCGNLASALVGGMPGAGQMGATLVNMSSGGATRLSGILEGLLALLAVLLLSSLVAWVPIAALAGILLVIGVRMIDWKCVNLLKSRATAPDFLVILAVVVVAKTISLIAASGVGIGLAILLFLREQIGGTMVRRKIFGGQIFSKRSRVPEAMALLCANGEQTVVFELQGSLFFGTADQIYTTFEPEAKNRRYIILDMRRVRSVDASAVHALELIRELSEEHGGMMIFCGLPKDLLAGRDVKTYLKAGLVGTDENVQAFDSLDAALEWVEDHILAEVGFTLPPEALLELKDIALFKERKDETLQYLDGLLERRRYRAGEKIFNSGDLTHELFLIRRGTVRLALPMPGGQSYHLTTIGAGNFFGEMAFLNSHPRSANAIAMTDVDLFVLSRAAFDAVSTEHKRMAINLITALASTLALRLRYADAELTVAWDA